MKDQSCQIDSFPNSDLHFQGEDDRVLREKYFGHAVPDNHAGERIDDKGDVIHKKYIFAKSNQQKQKQ
jgi:hypothetical protein